MILMALGIACSDSGIPQTEPNVSVEPLNGACTGGVTKEKARLNCPNWSDDGVSMTGFNCPQNGFLGLKTFRVQAGAPAGKNWYRVTWSDTPGGANRNRYDQCSCSDAAPCTTISALVAPSSNDSFSAAGSAAPETYTLATRCGSEALSAIKVDFNRLYGCALGSWKDSGSQLSSQSCTYAGEAEHILIADMSENPVATNSTCYYHVRRGPVTGSYNCWLNGQIQDTTSARGVYTYTNGPGCVH